MIGEKMKMLFFFIFIYCLKLIRAYSNNLIVSFYLHCEKDCTEFSINSNPIATSVNGCSSSSYFDTYCYYTEFTSTYNEEIIIKVERKRSGLGSEWYAELGGYVVIDGYVFKVSNNEVWRDPGCSTYIYSTPYPTYHCETKITGGKGGNGGFHEFKLKIPKNEDDLKKSNWNSVKMQYNCNSDEIKKISTETATIDISAYITPKSTTYGENIEEIMFSSVPSRGTLYQDGSGFLVENKKYDATTSVVYTPSTTSTGGNAYREIISFYAYKNDKKEKNCNGGSIKFIICGDNCVDCQESSGGSVKCTGCLSNFAFLEDNVQKCVSINRDGYYLDGTHLRKCYSTCKTCSAAGSYTNHKCDTCLDTLDYSQNNTDGTFNCFSSCSGLKEIEDTKECVSQCKDGYSLKYGTNKCLYSCSMSHSYLLVSARNECVDTCPNDYPYISGDGTECVQDCLASDGYPLISDTKQCVINCKTDQVTLNNKQCADDCSTTYPSLVLDSDNCISSCSSQNLYIYLTPNQCVSTCSGDGIYEWYQSETNKKCTKKCDGVMPYLDEIHSTCVQSCKDNTTDTPYILPPDDICVHDCSGSYPQINPNNNKCVTHCPSTHPFILGYSSTCVQKCEDTPDNKFISSDGKRCLTECSPDYEIINQNKCIAVCEGTFPYIFDEEHKCLDSCKKYGYYNFGDNLECVSSCVDITYPYKYEINNIKKCTDKCGADLPYTDDISKECVARCPADRPYALPPENICSVKCNKQYPYIYDGKCVNVCPSSPSPYISGDLTECVSDCTGSYPYISADGKKCVTECLGTEYLKLNDKQCSAQCVYPYKFSYEVGSSCYQDCQMKGLKYYGTESKCVDQCDDTYPFLLNSVTCTDSCPGYVDPTTKDCISTCPTSTPYYMPPNNICVAQCGGDYQYLDTTTKLCVKKCVSPVGLAVENGKKCYAACPNDNKYKLFDKDICVNQCDGIYPYYYPGDMCIQQCDTNYPYIDVVTNKCVTTCGSINKLINGDTNECVNPCTVSFPYKVAKYTQCVRICPNDVKFLYEEGGECLEHCPSSHKYYLPISFKCVSQCAGTSSPYIIKATNECVDRCKDTYSYLVVESDGKEICYASCPGNQPYELGDTFVCSSSCDSIYKYKQDMKCVRECGGTLSFLQKSTGICVSDCLSIGEKIYGPSGKTCVMDCEDNYPYLVEGTNQCVATCPSDKKFLYKEGFSCLAQCPANYIKINPSNNQCVSSCPTNFPYEHETTHLCYDICPTDAPLLDVATNTCVAHCKSGDFEIPSLKQCVTDCPTEFHYKIYALNQCVSECDSVYNLIDKIHFECLDSCANTHHSAYLQYGKLCISACPLFTKETSGECIFDLNFKEQTEDFIITDLVKDDIVDILDINIGELADLGTSIKGEDFILQVYPSDEPLPDNEETSKLNISQCEAILRKEYNIPESEKLIVAKFDYINKTSTINQVEYKIYDSEGNPLNMSPCNAISSDVLYPINNLDAFNYEEGYNMYLNNKIDIYNPEDPFFNDICYQYEENDNNLLLSDRREMYYQNVSLCEEGCKYESIDYTAKKINCNCTTKTAFTKETTTTTTLLAENIFSTKKVDPPIISVGKCYQLIADWNNLHFNLGFWFFGGINIVSIVLTFVVSSIEMTQLYTKINTFMKSNPPQEPAHIKIINRNYFQEYDNSTMPPNEKEEMNGAFKVEPVSEKLPEVIEEKVEIKDDANGSGIKNHLDDTLSFDLSRDKMVNGNCSFDNSIDFYAIFNEHSMSDKVIALMAVRNVDNYNYLLAYENDKRSGFEMAWSLLKQRHLILRAITRVSPFELVSLDISLYLFYIGITFNINALLYNHNDFKMSKSIETIDYSRICVRGIISFLIATTVLIILTHLIQHSTKFESVFIDVNQNRRLSQLVKRIIREIRIKHFFFSMIQFVLLISFWYYVTIYCIVYNTKQYDWFYSGWVSVVLSIVMSLLFCFIVTIFRLVGLRLFNRNMYNISLFMKKLYLI